MPSDLPDLDLQQQDQPLVPQHPPQSEPDTDAFRTNLHQLDITAQSLKAEKAALEHQLQQVRQKIFANDLLIRRTMESLGSQLFQDQRAERQSTFQTSTIENENFIEAMYYQMQANPGLMKAINAIVKEEGTMTDSNAVLAAIMTELTGNSFGFGHELAARVLEYEKERNDALAAMAGPGNDERPFDRPLPLMDPAIAGPPASEVRDPSVIALGDSREPSVMSMTSPSIKSEAASIATPYTAAAHMPTVNNGLFNFGSGDATASIETPTRRPARETSVVAQGMTSLQRSFPGLLESIAAPATRASPKATAPSPVNKRTRATARSDSMSPPANRGNKRAKADRDAAISHTFINYMKHLEQIHRSGKSISTSIRCSRCQQLKRDVRVLNCLHMYCHRCILQLRGQAQTGNAVTGFNSTCVYSGCNQVVSGKTTVIDSEIIDFLQWYDQQSPAITSMPCQLHVLNTAVAKYPKDNEIKEKLHQVQGQVRAMQSSAFGDQFVDLMVIAKLVRKPYIT